MTMQTRNDIKLGAADIAALVRREIARGNFKTNDRLPPERVLAETYGAARGTVRKALSRLEEEGLVETRAGSGTYVVHRPNDTAAAAIDNATPLELMDTRFALEPHICRLAVMHGRQTDFASLETLCDGMERSVDDPVGFSELDTEFHLKLAESTRNGLLTWIISQIGSVRSQEEWARMRSLTLDAETVATYNVQHRAILEAIRTRHPETAAKAMREHLETARLSLTRAADT